MSCASDYSQLFFVHHDVPLVSSRDLGVSMDKRSCRHKIGVGHSRAGIRNVVSLDGEQLGELLR